MDLMSEETAFGREIPEPGDFLRVKKFETEILEQKIGSEMSDDVQCHYFSYN